MNIESVDKKVIKDHNGREIVTIEQAITYARHCEWRRDMYARAWLRELGGKVFNKSYFIDALVLTTRWMRERSERLAVIEARERYAEHEKEYGPHKDRLEAERIYAATKLQITEPMPTARCKAI